METGSGVLRSVQIPSRFGFLIHFSNQRNSILSASSSRDIFQSLRLSIQNESIHSIWREYIIIRSSISGRVRDSRESDIEERWLQFRLSFSLASVSGVHRVSASLPERVLLYSRATQHSPVQYSWILDMPWSRYPRRALLSQV